MNFNGKVKIAHDQKVLRNVSLKEIFKELGWVMMMKNLNIGRLCEKAFVVPNTVDINQQNSMQDKNNLTFGWWNKSKYMIKRWASTS